MTAYNANTLLAPGSYAIGVSDTLTNFPSGFTAPGTVVVGRPPKTNANDDVIQTFTDSNHNIWIRTRSGPDETWGAPLEPGGIKTVRLTGTTGVSAGTIAIPHGISDVTKIINMSIAIHGGAAPNMKWISEGYPVNGWHFYWDIDATNVNITTVTDESIDLVSSPIRVTIEYTA